MAADPAPDTTQDDLLIVARVPPAGVQEFLRYEDAVLALLGAHGGELLERLRSADGTLEVHVIRFPSPAALESYLDDPRRAAAQPLLVASGARIDRMTIGPPPQERAGPPDSGTASSPPPTAPAGTTDC